jgi:hypothetical protein
MRVLEGLKGKPVAELCAEHQISQAPSDQGREQLLAHAPTAFEVHAQSQREARLARANIRWKTLVGELTLALKKSDEVLGSAGPPRPWWPHAMQACCRVDVS